MAVEYIYRCENCDEELESIGCELDSCPLCYKELILISEEDKLYECTECGGRTVEYPWGVCSNDCFKASML